MDVAFLLMAAPAGFMVAHMVRRWMEEKCSCEGHLWDEYGDVMMIVLGHLETNEEKRRYLQSDEHLGLVGRCDCNVYALPSQVTKVRDDDRLHSIDLCQPNREVISQNSD